MKLGYHESTWLVSRTPDHFSNLREITISVNTNGAHFQEYLSAEEAGALAAEINAVLEDVAAPDVVTEPF